MIASRVIVVALLAGFATALPHRVRDSGINEPAVSAPNGTPITAGTQPMATAADNGSSGSWSSSSVDSSADSSADSATSPIETSSAVMTEASTTTVAGGSYQTPTYGSGSSNWGSSSWSSGSNYNDCVSQCLAQYGNAPQPWTPPPTQTSPDSGSSSGSGVTHTVIVAPSQGVLRYVPFAVNASVGDTVRFMWNANNHTVTKSSSLQPCNNTADSPFTSGLQLKDFVFDQIVNDTNPTFFHCTVLTHCQKGMFGIINPPSNSGAGTSVSLMMSSWTSSNPDLSAYAAITTNSTMNSTVASGWGGNIDVASLPEWSHPMVAENVLYTRNFLAANPDAIKDNGSVDLSNSSGAPLMIPQDVSNALNNANSGPSSTSSVPSSSPTSATSAVASSSTPTASQTPNGAMTTSPKFVVALAVAAASFFLL